MVAATRRYAFTACGDIRYTSAGPGAPLFATKPTEATRGGHGKEPAWHRRQRHRRQKARKRARQPPTDYRLLTLLRDRALLQNHHGSKPALAMAEMEWVCSGADCATPNYMWKTNCRMCGRYYVGNEKVMPRKRSSSARRRETKARNNAGVNVDQLAEKVAALLNKSSSSSGDGPTSATPSSQSAPTPPPPPMKPQTDEEKRIQKVIVGKKKMLKQLESIGDKDSQTVQALKRDVEQAEQQREEMLPLDKRIEAQTKLLGVLQQQKTKAEQNLQKALDEVQSINEKLDQGKAKLDSLQSQLHDQTATQSTKEVTPLQNAIALAKQSGDKELFYMLTGAHMAQDAPQGTPPAGSASSGSLQQQRSPTALVPFRTNKRHAAEVTNPEDEEMQDDSAFREKLIQAAAQIPTQEDGELDGLI
eukprot:TRINITY_DN65332_c0_g1_i1.p2 TRINITY_DN65332_c0_g1~~TRINITY_DN65332_c0_g1_i1.p2  ORF type:complete len:418 (-),score=124.97 TRINITY_DN65332_c0_g1_i1:388-1641(-)